jgi:hypothetical protein
MKDNLDVAEALGMLEETGKESLLGTVNDFGRSTLCAETTYEQAACRSLFLDGGGQPRSREEYDRAGLQALLALVQDNDPDAYRRSPGLDAGLWELMKSAGPFNFKPLFPALTSVELENVIGDYVLVRWWSQTMVETAGLLAQVDANPDNKALRNKLGDHLAKVARNTKPRWDDPWGLLVMDIVSGRSAQAVVQITSPRLTFEESRT